MRYAERSTPRGSGKGSPSTWSSHGQSGPADLVEQRVEPIEARLGDELGLVAFAAHGREQAPHLGKCGPARLLDSSERLAVLRQRIGELVPDGAHLEHHHADGVGDDVVELAGDPRTLLGHGDACRRLALALGLDRAGLGRLGLALPFAESEAGEPGDAEQERDEDELAVRCLGVVVDDERRAAEHDRQAQPGLHGVAQVPEQERGGDSEEEDARSGP